MKLFVTVLSSGWQRFRRPPWSSWRKGTQSEYEERTCGFWGQPSLETAVRFLKYKPTISYNSSPSSSTFCSLSSVPSPHWLQHQGLLVVQRAPPIHLTDMPVVADVNAKPGKLIWPFDPVTRGGTDSRPTGAAFNLALDDHECWAWCLWNLGLRRSLNEITEQYFNPYPMLSNYRAHSCRQDDYIDGYKYRETYRSKPSVVTMPRLMSVFLPFLLFT